MAKKIIRGEKDLSFPSINVSMSDEMDIFTDKNSDAHILIDGKLKRINNKVETVDGIYPSETTLNVSTRRELTRAEYKAIATPNPNIYYFLTDARGIMFNGVQYGGDMEKDNLVYSNKTQFTMTYPYILDFSNSANTERTGDLFITAPMVKEIIFTRNGNIKVNASMSFPNVPMTSSFRIDRNGVNVYEQSYEMKQKITIDNFEVVVAMNDKLLVSFNCSSIPSNPLPVGSLHCTMTEI